MANKTQVATTNPAGPGTNLAPVELSRNTGLVARIAARFAIDADKMLDTLKATAFRQRPAKEGKQQVVVTNEHMMMLLVVAEQYHLNPFTREIYAFPQDGGIVPIIPIDGWLRIVNEHPQLQYIEVELAPEGTAKEEAWAECTIKRRDRDRPIKIREYLSECYRSTDPWNSHPKRMLRHKAIIQCARVAFGFAGVFDPDEGERIYANAINVTPPKESAKSGTREPQAKKPAPIDVVDDEKGPRVSTDQAIAIADKLEAEGVSLSRFLAGWEIGSIEEIAASDYGAAIRAIDDLSAITD